MLRGTYAERKQKLSNMTKDWLEAAILDSEYNDFIRARADDGNEKRVPYIGWFWRHIEFSDPTKIPIGDCGSFIGFMANDKWDHPERLLTESEAMHIIGIIDEAMELNQQGGSAVEINNNTNAKLREVWDYMQTLRI
jgi:hypothetical protein